MDNDIIYIRKRKIKHWVIVLIFLLMILTAVKLKVTRITVLGARSYTDEEAIALILPTEGDRRTVSIVINNLLKKKKRISFVADYEIRLTGPTSAELIIYEQNPIACVRYMSNYMYFDSDGVVLESMEERIEGVPVVEGLSFGHIVLDEELPLSDPAVLKDILGITQETSINDIDCDYIRFDSAGGISLVLDDGDILVKLGDNDNLSVKISVMGDMLRSIRDKGLKGTLDLSEYDESVSGQVISFKISG